LKYTVKIIIQGGFI